MSNWWITDEMTGERRPGGGIITLAASHMQTNNKEMCAHSGFPSVSQKRKINPKGLKCAANILYGYCWCCRLHLNGSEHPPEWASCMESLLVNQCNKTSTHCFLLLGHRSQQTGLLQTGSSRRTFLKNKTKQTKENVIYVYTLYTQ